MQLDQELNAGSGSGNVVGDSLWWGDECGL